MWESSLFDREVRYPLWLGLLQNRLHASFETEASHISNHALIDDSHADITRVNLFEKFFTNKHCHLSLVLEVQEPSFASILSSISFDRL